MEPPAATLRQRSKTTPVAGESVVEDDTTQASASPTVRPGLSRRSTGESSTPPTFDLSQDETMGVSGLLDVLVTLEAHAELWTRTLRQRTAPWKSRADRLLDESRAKAKQRIDAVGTKIPRVKSEHLLLALGGGGGNGTGFDETGSGRGAPARVLSPKDREKLEKRYRELRSKMAGNLQRLSQKWEEEKTVRLRDKISFFFGVMHVLCSALLLGFAPTYIPLYYSLQVAVYLPLRVYAYKKRDYQYFLFDLCYAINALCLVYLWVLPGNRFLFEACYGLTLGSLGTAIATWRNSLVFHSLDKVISLAIHIFPPFVFTTIVHFYPHSEQRYPAVATTTISTRPWHAMIISMSTYLVWQVLYFQFVIVARRDKIKQGRATSFTFLINDKKRLIGKIAAKVPEGLREGAFILGQAVYTFVTLLIPIFVLYDSKFWSSVYLIIVFGVSVWNGASFYLEVFGRKFEKQLVALRREYDEQQAQLSRYVAEAEASVPASMSVSRAESTNGDAEVEEQADDDEDGDEALEMKSTESEDRAGKKADTAENAISAGFDDVSKPV